MSYILISRKNCSTKQRRIRWPWTESIMIQNTGRNTRNQHNQRRYNLKVASTLSSELHIQGGPRVHSKILFKVVLLLIGHTTLPKIWMRLGIVNQVLLSDPLIIFSILSSRSSLWQYQNESPTHNKLFEKFV